MISQKIASKNAERLYDKIAVKHEKLRENDKKVDSEVLSRLFELLPKNLKNKTLLDAGCGSAIFSQMLLKRGVKKAVCFDISSKMVDLAKKRIKNFELKNIEVFKSDLINKKLKSNSFDIILVIYVLPYVSELENVFKEFYRLLKKDGLILIASDFYEIKYEKLRRTKIDYIVGGIKMSGILHTKDDYMNSVKENKFKIKDFFSFKQAHGLEINPNYKYKDSVKQFTFGAVFKK